MLLFFFLLFEQEISFRVEYKVEALAGREFGSVFLGTQNVAKLVVQNGWAKVIIITTIIFQY